MPMAARTGRSTGASDARRPSCNVPRSNGSEPCGEIHRRPFGSKARLTQEPSPNSALRSSSTRNPGAIVSADAGVATGILSTSPHGAMPCGPSSRARVQPVAPSADVSQEPSETIASERPSASVTSSRATSPAGPAPLRATRDSSLRPACNRRETSTDVGCWKDSFWPTALSLTLMTAWSSAATVSTALRGRAGNSRTRRKNRISPSLAFSPQIHCGAGVAACAPGRPVPMARHPNKATPIRIQVRCMGRFYAKEPRRASQVLPWPGRDMRPQQRILDPPAGWLHGPHDHHRMDRAQLPASCSMVGRALATR